MLTKPIRKKAPYCKNNKVKLIHGGHEFFSLLEEMINSAHSSIHLQTYIFNEDETGRKIAQALKKSAQRGIQVHLMVDGYASQNLSKRFIKTLEDSGINFRFFEPILKCQYFYLGRRLHHKVVVVDSRCALVGGVNIANRYNDVRNIRAWKDMAVFVEGEIAYDLDQYCNALWYKEKSQLSFPARFDKPNQLLPYNDQCSVRLRRNDWVKAKREIWRTYFYLFNNATESITIMCSYFLPGQELRKAISKASERGVKVKVILAGPSDIPMVKHAERYLYNWMLRNNIEIYEYQPSVLHAKLAVVDGHWVTIGSYNINNISAYASIELNLDIRNKPFARNVYKELDEIIEKECIQISQKNFKYTFPFFNLFLQRLSYEVIRFMLYLFTFYFKQEE